MKAQCDQMRYLQGISHVSHTLELAVKRGETIKLLREKLINMCDGDIMAGKL